MNKNIINLILLLITFIILLIINNYLKNNKNENFNNNDDDKIKTICVSGFWNVKNKYGNDKYKKWFKNSLKINEKYIFYCTDKDKEWIKEFRQNLPTEFINYSINDFYTKKDYKDYFIHEVHVPSKELGQIWLEKINLIKLTKEKYPDYDFYIWIDAGICVFRDKEPEKKKFSQEVLKSLPEDKLSYSYVNEEYHKMSGGVLIVPNNIVEKIHKLFYKEFKQCAKKENNWKCGSDQYIFTKLINKYPELFNKIAEGYGENLPKLFG